MVTLFNKPARRISPYSRPGMHRTEKPSLHFDPLIVGMSVFFVITGLLFTYSASAFETSSFVKRQFLFDIIGITAAWILSYKFSDLIKLRAFKPDILLYISWGLLLYALFFTRAQAHTHRWIDVGGLFKLQPSEFAKVALVIYLAACLEQTAGKLGRDKRYLLKPLGMAGFTLLLIVLGKDLGTPLLMGWVLLTMLFVSGARKMHLAILATAGSLGGLVFMLTTAYRRARLLSFLHLTEDSGTGVSYQVMQSFMAVGSGGWLGKGFGNSELKLQYLPAAHTDFIFSVMCEEAGLLVLLVVLGFTLLLWRGILLTKRAKSTFNGMVIFGLMMTLCSQAFFNMGMAIGLLPTKGIALPFFSYGGSSVVMTLVMIGIILNLAAVDHSAPVRKNPSYYTSRMR